MICWPASAPWSTGAALPLATRNLVISQPALGEWSGTGGGLVLGIEHALTVDALSHALRRDF